MRRILLLAAIMAFAAAGSGCTFAQDRLKDLVDVGGLKFVGGPGSKVGIGFGAAKTGFTIGYYRFEKFGFQGRAMGVTEETGLEFLAPADHHLEAVWGNRELFDMVAEFQAIDGYASRAALFDYELTYPRRRFHTPDGFHLTDIDAVPFDLPLVFFPTGLLGLGDMQLTFAPLFFGVELNLRIYHLFDYLAGCLYIDNPKDDARNYTPVGPHEE
jgi:hypothetical protein